MVCSWFSPSESLCNAVNTFTSAFRPSTRHWHLFLSFFILWVTDAFVYQSRILKILWDMLFWLMLCFLRRWRASVNRMGWSICLCWSLHSNQVPFGWNYRCDRGSLNVNHEFLPLQLFMLLLLLAYHGEFRVYNVLFDFCVACSRKSRQVSTRNRILHLNTLVIIVEGESRCISLSCENYVQCTWCLITIWFFNKLLL